MTFELNLKECGGREKHFRQREQNMQRQKIKDHVFGEW